MSAPVNVITTRTGTVRPVCEFCGRMGRAVAPDAVSERGHIDIFALGRGWAVAPYPPDHVHRDGSTGDLFECPACRRRLQRGESLRARAYLTPEGDDDATPAEHAERSAARAKASYRAGTETRQAAESYVSNVLGEYAPEHDVPATVDELHEQVGSWDMRAAPSVDFWRVVRAHGLDVPAPAPHCTDWPLCGHEGGCP